MKDFSNFLSSIEDIINDAKLGKKFILIDEENRENEGDLIIPAEFITPEEVNFMIKNCSGIICLAITSERAKMLDLQPMVEKNNSSFSTPFAVSIEARTGITTGVSAFDRAHTIKLATCQNANKADIVSPGHIFPLIAKAGGIFARTGHTEASVDICKLAGLSGSAVICEVINPDGTMSRLPELIKFATTFGIKISTIENLIKYRQKVEKIIQEVEKRITYDKATLMTFKDTIENLEHYVMIKGDIKKAVVFIQPWNLKDQLLSEINVHHMKEKYSDIVYIIPNKTALQHIVVAQILRELKLENIALLKYKNDDFKEIESFGIAIKQEILL